MRRSLGDKRRELGVDDINATVRECGNFRESETSKVFDNADFGYTRVTVEQPLRLRYQMDIDRKARFLDACPRLLDDVQAIDKKLGRTPLSDWNEVRDRILEVLRNQDSDWKATEHKLFRDVFTDIDPKTEPVILRSGKMTGPIGKGKLPGQTLVGEIAPNRQDRLSGFFPDPTGKTKKVIQYEPDPNLRDFENIPLKEDIKAYFEREVLPHVSDAWMDRSKDKVGYEINFNHFFYRYEPPRSLEQIDADLKKAEEEILRVLKEVTT
jgi:type I restriction enzyme M protein